MTPVRTPDVVRGDVPGLMILGTPCSIPEEPWCVCTSDEDEGVTKIAWNDGAYGYFKPSDHECRINWSFPLAIYAALHWLADRGHVCLWMLPTTHGGKVSGHSGLTAWEVSAILVSRSVVRVERGLGPVRDLLSDWRSDCFTYYREPYVGKERVWVYLTDADRMTDIGWALGRPRRGIPSGPETGDAGKLAADTAAIADGCALQVPGGILLPD